MVLVITTASCTKDAPDDPGAGQTTCGIPSKPIIDAAGSDHYTVDESDVPLPLNPDDPGALTYTCDISIGGIDVVTLLAGIDGSRVETDLAYIRDSEVKFKHAGGQGGVTIGDSGDASGRWRCGTVQVNVGVHNESDATEHAETLTKILAERAGCAKR